MTTFDLRATPSVAVGEATLSFGHQGVVVLRHADAEVVRAKIDDLTSGVFVEVWVGDGYAYFVAEEGKAVWRADAARETLSDVATLDRLDFQGGYDPGGLHRVEFRALAEGDVLVVYEYGLVRLGREGELHWHRVHGDVAAHLSHISEGVAWYRNEHNEFGIRLDDGGHVLSREA